MARFSDIDLRASDILRDTWARCRSWAPRMVGLYAVVFGPYLAAYALDVFEPLGVYGPSVILSFLFPLADGALMAWMLSDDDLSMGQALRVGVRCYLPLLMTRFLKYVAIGVGVFALVVPAIMMGAWFILSDPLIVAGRSGKDPFAPLFASRRRVRGYTLPVVVAMAPLVLITQVGGLAPVIWGDVAQENVDPALWTHFFNVFLDLMYLALTVMSVVVYERLTSEPAAPKATLKVAPPGTADALSPSGADPVEELAGRLGRSGGAQSIDPPARPGDTLPPLGTGRHV